MSLQEKTKMDKEFTGPYPRYSGAISTVINGPPEDMNAMPASTDAETSSPVYDGSDLDALSVTRVSSSAKKK